MLTRTVNQIQVFKPLAIHCAIDFTLWMKFKKADNFHCHCCKVISIPIGMIELSKPVSKNFNITGNKWISFSLPLRSTQVPAASSFLNQPKNEFSKIDRISNFSAKPIFAEKNFFGSFFEDLQPESAEKSVWGRLSWNFWILWKVESLMEQVASI